MYKQRQIFKIVQRDRSAGLTNDPTQEDFHPCKIEKVIYSIHRLV